MPDPKLQIPELKEKLRFEELIAELSSRFVNMPSDEVDGAIEDVQRRVCQTLGVDLSVLWLWSDIRPSQLTVTHVHIPPDGPERPGHMDAKQAFPWIYERVMAGQTLVITTRTMPPEASVDQQTRTFFGVKSSVVLPMSVGGESPMGALSFDTLHEEREWSEQLISRLRLVSQLFTNALVRRDTERSMRESATRLKLAADSANAGLWELNCSNWTFWATERARKIFGYGPDELIRMETFEAMVVPEDRPTVRQAIEDAIVQGSPINIEYQVVLRDGTRKWVASRGDRSRTSDDGERDRLLGATVDVTERKEREDAFRASCEENKRLKEKIEAECNYLKAEIELTQKHGDVIGTSDAIRQALHQAEKVAPTDSTVLITGETGTGKELVAHEIHRLGSRRDKLLVKVNCAALPSSLIESELFGRERGAFTGALNRQIGRFELADNSTLFLDEIGELSLEVQAKLLRVLQNGEFERLGSPRTIRTDVRLIAATNRDLVEKVRQGQFREDLYYRISVFPIAVPPLRDRAEDIPLLVWAFLSEFSSKMGKKVTQISNQTMEDLKQRPWPGNVRELRNVIEHSVIMTTGETLAVTAGPDQSITTPPVTLAECERQHIIQTLERTQWTIKGPEGAAELLGLQPSTLYSRMRKLGIPTSGEHRGAARAIYRLQGE